MAARGMERTGLFEERKVRVYLSTLFMGSSMEALGDVREREAGGESVISLPSSVMVSVRGAHQTEVALGWPLICKGRW